MAGRAITTELKKWDENVFFKAQFKEETRQKTSMMERLDKISKLSLEHFVTIAANSEPLVYKIGRYFIEIGDLKFEHIHFIDGLIVKSYIGDDASEWRKKERCDDFFKVFGPEMKNKFVIIPCVDFKVSVGLAIYFLTNVRSSGATGLIFYGEGDDNLAEVLHMNFNDPYLFEFPNKKYRPRKKQLVDDEY